MRQFILDVFVKKYNKILLTLKKTLGLDKKSKNVDPYFINQINETNYFKEQIQKNLSFNKDQRISQMFVDQSGYSDKESKIMSQAIFDQHIAEQGGL